MNIFRLVIKKLWFRSARPGSALILTMFIIAGMLIVASTGAYIILVGIKASGIQSQSTKAYFGAEAGAERILYEIRQNGYIYSSTSSTAIFTDTLSTSGVTYNVYFSDYPPLVFTSIGDFQNTKRSVEIRM